MTEPDRVLVSVVIPTFQRAALLPRALESVRRQTRPADEVIVVDDGSTDGTADLLRRDHPKVRCLRRPNGGVSAARNQGIEAAQGEWIALLDSDDVWRPDKLERQLDALAARPDRLVCHTDEIWVRDGRRVNPGLRHTKHGGRIFRHCLPLCAISPSAAVIHRSVLAAVGLFDEELPACEDYDLWLRITSRYPVLLVEEPLVEKHGGHPDQLSRSVTGLDRYRIRALVKILEAGRLAPDDHAAAVATLREKCRIWADGAAVRGRHEEAATYRDLARRWRRAATGVASA
ncbi:MAG: glycosyltransferase family 2 protein [Thermoanaerobaculia bacterium]